MTGQQQSRISSADEESVNALLQDYLDSAIEEEGNEQPFVARVTKAERDRVWIAWTAYAFPFPPSSALPTGALLANFVN